MTMKINPMNRRFFLFAGGTAAVGLAIRYSTRLAYAHSDAKLATPHDVTIVEFSDQGQRGKTVTLRTIVKSDAEWKQQLPAESFDVTRHAGTEYAYSGKYWNLHDKGMFRCICCNNALFLSDTKFESGTGWPSFWQPIAKENVLETSDGSLGMERTTVSCKLCEAHLGHVFDDGPRPTGLRYCMNSVALKFVKFA
jgi:peptide-methionine (R)-S-oxide reductase